MNVSSFEGVRLRKRLILHAGMPKTGTTSLQKHMALNSGCYYCFPTSGRYAGSNAHHEIFRAISSRPDYIHTPLAQPRRFEELVVCILEEFALTSSDTLILSSELLWNTLAFTREDLERLLSAFSDFDIFVIAMTRDPDKHAYSAYSQRVCGIQHYSGSFSEHIKELKGRGMWDYSARFELYNEVFGMNMVHRIDYEKAKANLVASFFQTLNIPHNSERLRMENVRRPWPYVRIKRMLNNIEKSGKSTFRYSVLSRLAKAAKVIKRGSFIDNFFKP